MFGESVWRRLDPAARTFLATAESIFRRNREDPGFDFSPVVIDLAKAMEVQARVTLATILKRAPASVRTVIIDGSPVDLMKSGRVTLGQLAYVLDHGATHRAIRDLGPRYTWVAESLGPLLNELKTVRNPAAHSERTSLEAALQMRNKMVGVGCEGSLVALTKAT